MYVFEKHYGKFQQTAKISSTSGRLKTYYYLLVILYLLVFLVNEFNEFIIYIIITIINRSISNGSVSIDCCSIVVSASEMLLKLYSYYYS